MLSSLFKSKKRRNLHTIAFYNLENLFDTKNDLDSLDEDFTPNGKKNWTPKRYHKKLGKLAKTIAEIGREANKKPPVLIGVAEVENKKVMEDLIATKPLNEIKYETVHFDSPDERGIDTGLIYHTDYFKILKTETITLKVFSENGNRDTTRDILYVKGELNKEEVHVFVNHWPSRRDGGTSTEHKRIEAAHTVLKFMSKIEEEYANPNYIIMGDFNASPNDKSMETLMESGSLYNPMKQLLSPIRGSANYKRKWSLFDQILFSHNFFNYEKGTHSFAEADIFDDHSLKEWKGKYKGIPFRTYAGRKYKGGYSDHFPVYIQLKYNS